MRNLLWVVLAAATLALPGTALAGGWATVELSSTPTGLAPGETWSVKLEVLQHGRTPLDGVEPAVTIDGPGGSKRFAAEPAGKPGLYAAEVVFPTAGRWTYEVDDGFTQTHSYPPVRIARASAPARETEAGSGTSTALAAGLGAGLLAALATLILRRRRA